MVAVTSASWRSCSTPSRFSEPARRPEDFCLILRAGRSRATPPLHQHPHHSHVRTPYDHRARLNKICRAERKSILERMVAFKCHHLSFNKASTPIEQGTGTKRYGCSLKPCSRILSPKMDGFILEQRYPTGSASGKPSSAYWLSIPTTKRPRTPLPASTRRLVVLDVLPGQGHRERLQRLVN